MGCPGVLGVCDCVQMVKASNLALRPSILQVDLDRNLIMTGEAMVLPQIGDKLRRKLMRALQVRAVVRRCSKSFCVSRCDPCPGER